MFSPVNGAKKNCAKRVIMALCECRMAQFGMNLAHREYALYRGWCAAVWKDVFGGFMQKHGRSKILRKKHGESRTGVVPVSN